MFTRISVLVSFAILFCFPIYINAADRLTAPPFQNLQQQNDELTRQLGYRVDRFTPPKISYTLSCIDAFSLTIDLSIADDKEITYYAIQEQGGDPPTNIITFVEPGLASLNYPFTVSPGLGVRKFLFIASDTNGNTSKSLLQIDPDICFGPCPPGAICP